MRSWDRRCVSRRRRSVVPGLSSRVACVAGRAGRRVASLTSLFERQKATSSKRAQWAAISRASPSKPFNTSCVSDNTAPRRAPKSPYDSQYIFIPPTDQRAPNGPPRCAPSSVNGTTPPTHARRRLGSGYHSYHSSRTIGSVTTSDSFLASHLALPSSLFTCIGRKSDSL